MKRNISIFFKGICFFKMFVIWTILIQIVDVKPLGVAGSNIGFSTMNCWFHKLTGVHMWIYTVTDWLGLEPVFICIVFGVVGLVQLIKRRDLFKVDASILLLGIYYILVIVAYLAFEMLPINYRPVLIDGRLEQSYPSSTTLLVLSVMPTFVYQIKGRISDRLCVNVLTYIAMLFAGLMVFGRLVAGVHWLTDIVGSILISAGLFCIYKATVLLCEKE